MHQVLPLFTPTGIAERVRTATASGHHTSGQIAVLMALAVIQSADAEHFNQGHMPPDERRRPSVTVATVAAWARLTTGTVQKHLRYWAERPGGFVVRDSRNPSLHPAYFIGA